MYGASQGEIGQYDDRVCLEVGANLLSSHTEGVLLVRDGYIVFLL